MIAALIALGITNVVTLFVMYRVIILLLSRSGETPLVVPGRKIMPVKSPEAMAGGKPLKGDTSVPIDEADPDAVMRALAEATGRAQDYDGEV